MKAENIVITGATRGIGRALTEKLLKMGHTVFGCGTNEEQLEVLANSTPDHGHFAKVDIMHPREISSWVREIFSKTPTVDRLICNAGTINNPAPFWEIENTAFDRVIDINVKGTANILRAFLTKLIQQENSISIAISSGAGSQGYPSISAYCASKFGIEGLCQSIAKDLPQNHSCIPLSPGVINTEMLQDYWGKERAQEKDTPEQWAEYAAPYILQLNHSHNGQSLRIPQTP